MAQTSISFTDVTLTYMREASGKSSELDKPQTVTVDVKRMSEQAEISVINPTEKKTIVKCNLSANQEMCRVSSLSYLIFVHADESILLKFKSSEELSRFRSLVDFRPLAKSVFDQRTEESSAVQYFQFYGYLSQQQNMMQDYVRTGTYQRAMLQNFINFQNKVVLDVGAGSGILSFFAMQAGAKKVYAVEASTMAEYTKKLVNCSQYAGRIVVIPGKIEEISLPEKVDVIISEPMGYMLFNERMLETYIHSKKFLKQPNGMMFPTVGDLHVAPFSDEQLYMEQFTKANFWYQQSFHGIDLSHLRDDAVAEYFRQPIVDTFDVRILMAKSVKYTVNFLTAQEEDLYRIEIPLRFTAHTSGTVHGLAFWFDIAFIGTISTVWLSTSPTEALTHWYQVRCLLRNPLFVKAGEVLLGKVVLRSNKRQSYDIDIEALVEATGCKSENTLDLKNPFFHYTGQVPSAPPGTHNSSPSDPYCSGVNASNAGGFENSQQQLANQQIINNHSTNTSQGNSMCYQNMDGQANNHNAAHCNVVPMLNAGSIPHPGTLGNTNSGGKASLTRSNHANPDQYTPASANAQHSYY